MRMRMRGRMTVFCEKRETKKAVSERRKDFFVKGEKSGGVLRLVDTTR